MNQPWQTHKPKNWQWRTIIILSLILIFGKSFGSWVYSLLRVDQVYATTTTVAKKVGLADIVTGPDEPPITTELIIDVKNDTPNDYSVETNIAAGRIETVGETLSAGEIKRFTIKPYEKIANPIGRGHIIFLSAPNSTEQNKICQEVHTLNYDLKDVDKIQQPLNVNISTIHSTLECKDTLN